MDLYAFGSIGSAPIVSGRVSFVDTWAGRGGFGSKLFQEHGMADIIYGGTFLDDDFRELTLDNLGFCPFHRGWAEEMLPAIVGSLYGMKDEFLNRINKTASRINSRNASAYRESERNFDFIYSYLKRKYTVGGNKDGPLAKWIQKFDSDKHEAALSCWYEIHKGIQESLREF